MANLLLARAAARRREIALRMALGAGRARVLRQLLAEGVCLSLAGSVLGLALAKLVVWAIVRLRPFELPRLDEVMVDWGVLLFTFGVALCTGILFGLVPALDTLGSDLRALKEAGLRGSAGGGRICGGLVAVEFALSVMLVIAAMLLIQTVLRLRMVDPGFDPSRVLMARVMLSGSRYQTAAQVASFARELVERVLAIPGVTGAATTNHLPLAGGFRIGLAAIEGHPDAQNRSRYSVEWYGITPQFFRTLRIRLLNGRELTGRDTAGATAVAIVNEAFARTYLPGEEAAGSRLRLRWQDHAREIVGVVADLHDRSLQSPAKPAVFVPLAQVSDAASALVNRIFPTTLLVRAAGDPRSPVQEAVRQVHAADPLLPVFEAGALEDVVGGSIQEERFVMLLLGAFALVALTLAAVGIYGVMSYAVVQRTREIGIRAALGASPGRLLGMTLGQGLALAATGLTFGVAGAWALTRVLDGFLFGVTARDPATFVAAPLAMTAVALAACLIPACRVLRIDPVTALRHE